jgi:small subunit ribosomal protein S11
MSENTTNPVVETDLAADAQEEVVVKSPKKGGAARVYVNASYNNTVVTITDTKGGVIAWSTAGSMGFNGPKKATPFASSKVVATLAEKLKQKKITDLEVFVKGTGGGRDSALRSFVAQGFNVTSFKDVTPIPHNGPRPKKVRRV